MSSSAMAAALSQPQSLEELITCPICMERMNNPKHLYCQHAFCDKCLVDWTSQPGNETKSISCPVCRKCTRLAEGIEELPADIAVNNLLGIVNEQNQTPVCGKDNAPAAAYCGECGHNLCHACVNTHIKDDTFKQHVETIKEMTCFSHESKPQTLYCTDCSKQGCTACMDVRHKGHSITDIAIVAKINKATLQYLNQSLQDLIKSAKDFPHMTNTADVKKMYEDLGREVQVHAQLIRRKMELWRMKMEMDLEERRKKHMKEVSELEAHITTCEELVSNIDHLLKSASDVLLTTAFSATSLRLHEATTALSAIPEKTANRPDYMVEFDQTEGEYGALVNVTRDASQGDPPKGVGTTVTKLRRDLVPRKSVCSISSQTVDCGSETPLLSRRQPPKLIGNNRAEITFQYTFEHLSQMKKRKESSKFVVRNIPWNLILDPREKSMDFFLTPNVSSKESKESKEPKEAWSCNASVMLKILNWKPYLEPFKRKFKHVYDQSLGWGYTDFITWKDLMNPKKGFVKDDKIRVEAHVTADMPVGVSQAESIEKMAVHVVTNDTFTTHQTSDLFDPDCCHCRVLRVDKKATLGEFMEILADYMQYTPQQLRPWPFVQRENETFRPEFLDIEAKVNTTIEKLASDRDPWTLFMETTDSCSAGELPSFDMNADVLLFFKQYIPEYIPETQSVVYTGHKYVPVKDKLESIVPFLNERAGFPKGTELYLYQEVKANSVNHIVHLDQPLEDAMDELCDGDIIIFQRKDPATTKPMLPTDFFSEVQL